MPVIDLAKHREKILEICRRHGAHDVRVFGSYLHGTARESSDLDLLVRMEQERTYFDLVDAESSLESTLGIPVQVLSEGGLQGRFRNVVLGEAQPL
jgi:predicted nucleotidyltransferase